MEGIDLDLVQLKFGEHMAGNVKKKAGRFSQERIFIANDFIRLTDAGKLFADGIAAELFED